MSLHEYLREGGEASYRLMNRLSHLIQNLDFSGLGSSFSFNPASSKNSWRDWDGKSAFPQLESSTRSLSIHYIRECLWLWVV